VCLSYFCPIIHREFKFSGFYVFLCRKSRRASGVPTCLRCLSCVGGSGWRRESRPTSKVLTCVGSPDVDLSRAVIFALTVALPPFILVHPAVTRYNSLYHSFPPRSPPAPPPPYPIRTKSACLALLTGVLPGRGAPRARPPSLPRCVTTLVLPQCAADPGCARLSSSVPRLRAGLRHASISSLSGAFSCLLSPLVGSRWSFRDLSRRRSRWLSGVLTIGTPSSYRDFRPRGPLLHCFLHSTL
jgi:hypothetical protein